MANELRDKILQLNKKLRDHYLFLNGSMANNIDVPLNLEELELLDKVLLKELRVHEI